MYQILATKMAVDTSGEVTQAVGMSGANAVTVEVTVFSGTLVSVFLDGSNDLENWTSTTAINTANLGVGAYYLPGSATAFSAPVKDIATQYVRLRFVGDTGGAVLAAGINTASL